MIEDLIKIAKDISIDDNMNLVDPELDNIYETMALTVVDMYDTMPKDKDMLLLGTIVKLMVENLVLKAYAEQVKENN
jgi:hypothetical protein